MQENTFLKTSRKLSPSDLDEVERAIGFSLPTALRSHYLIYNGGVPKRRFFVSTSGFQIGIHRFLTMKYPRHDGEMLFEKFASDLVVRRHLIPTTLIPFAINAGQDFICMVAASEEIAFYAMEDCETPLKATTIVASSLRSFIDKMDDAL